MDDHQLELLIKVIRESPEDPALVLRDLVNKMPATKERTALQMATLCLSAVRLGKLEVR